MKKLLGILLLVVGASVAHAQTDTLYKYSFLDGKSYQIAYLVSHAEYQSAKDARQSPYDPIIIPCKANVNIQDYVTWVPFKSGVDGVYQSKSSGVDEQAWLKKIINNSGRNQNQ